MGALSLTAWWLEGSRRRDLDRRRSAAAARPEPASDAATSSAPPADALPDAMQVAWIAGPAGSLRLAELHPEAGQTLVFVHGLGGRLEVWAPLLRDLGPGLRAVAIDLPGHGESDSAHDGDYSVPALAAAIGATLDGLGLRRVVLVAHSLGAAAAIAYAGRCPQRVEGMLLVDPAGDQTLLSAAEREAFLAPLRRDPQRELRWYFRRILGAAPEMTSNWVIETLSQTAPEVLLATLESSMSFSPLESLASFRGNVSMIVGELNAGPTSLPALREDLPVVRLPFNGHWLMLDRRREVLEALFDLLGMLRA